MLEDGVERLAITDFGLARAVDDATMTRSGVIAGTPQYMSPEQARGDSIDHRSDLFSLGSVLYTMCTGRPPFRADTTFGILRRITDSEPRSIREINPETPAWLCRLIEKLHAKSPADRLQSAEQVSSLLQGCLAHVQTTNAPLPLELSPGGDSRWKLGAFGVVATVAAAGIFSLFSWTGQAITNPVTRSVRPSNQVGAKNEVGAKPVTDTLQADTQADTEWNDPFAPSPADIHALVNQLEQEIEK